MKMLWILLFFYEMHLHILGSTSDQWYNSGGTVVLKTIELKNVRKYPFDTNQRLEW